MSAAAKPDIHNSAVEQFASLLRATDESGRKSLLSRANMLAMSEAPDASFEPPVRSLGEYLDTPIPLPPSLVFPTIVVRGEVTVTLGRAGRGKTTLNLNRVMKWAAGKPLFDDLKDKDGNLLLNPSKPLRTLIIENEGSAGMFHHKMGVMLNAPGYLSDVEKGLVRDNLFVWGMGGYSGLKLDDPALLANVRAGCNKCKPDILFVEPFRGLWKGDENSSTDMAVVIDNLIGIATDFECGIVLSHHERKSGVGDDGEFMSAGRGSTVLEGAAAVMENFQSVKGGDFRELMWSKARYLQPPPPVRLQYQVKDGWYTHIPNTNIEQSILEALANNSEEPLNKMGIADILDEKPTKIAPLLKKMTDDGRIKQMASMSSQHGSTGYRYRLVSSGDEEGLGF